MSGRSPIKVMIVDDHTMVRSGLAVLIAGFDDFELVGEAVNGREAIRLCAELQPDVVLMDLVMPEMDGISATRAIRKAHSDVEVVALTSFPEEELVQQVLKAGAVGFLLKDASVDELIEAIRAASEGKPTLTWQAAQALIDSTAQLSPPKYNLTQREHEVLALMIEGMTNRQIGTSLGVSRYTINAHVSNILSKLDVATRTEAVALALQYNLISGSS